MYTDYKHIYDSLYHSGVKGMKWGVIKARQKAYGNYSGLQSHFARTKDKKFNKSLRKSIDKDKKQMLRMTNKYEILAKKEFDRSKYSHLNQNWWDNKVNSKRASKISDKMNKEFEKNKGTLSKIAKDRHISGSIAGRAFLASVGGLIAAQKIDKYSGGRLKSVGQAVALGSLAGLTVSAISFNNWNNAVDKQFKTENEIYSRVKKSTRV